MLTTPKGQVILVDAGGFASFGRKRKSNLDIGEDVVFLVEGKSIKHHAEDIGEALPAEATAP